ncbi:MAG: hypothetical protein QOI95_2987 [Acidimicrobiaceae bacterium]|jgi:hypothetical protein
MAVAVFVLSVGLFAFAMARMRRARDARQAAAATVKLEVDSWGVKRWMADGRYEEVAWDELREVRVITLPRGPWDDRTRFVLDGGGERGCIVPLLAAESSDLIASLGALSGFDHRRLAEALDETRTGNRVLWARTST